MDWSLFISLIGAGTFTLWIMRILSVLEGEHNEKN